MTDESAGAVKEDDGKPVVTTEDSEAAPWPQEMAAVFRWPPVALSALVYEPGVTPRLVILS